MSLSHSSTRLLSVLVAVVLSFNLSAPLLAGECGAHPVSKKADIVDTAVAAGSFGTLVSAVKHAGLVDALRGDGPLTVFAPSDSAFAKLPAATLSSLLEPKNRDRLRQILTFHVVSGRYLAKDVVKSPGVTTLAGQRLFFSAEGDEVRVNGASVVQVDIECDNGVIHVIDSVMLPATDDIVGTAAGAGSFATLLKAATAAGLVPALKGDGPLTVLAPTDAAFAKLPAGTVAELLKEENRGQLAAILKYHVIPGRVYSDQALAAKSAKSLEGASLEFSIKGAQVRVGSARVVQADLDTTNGVIHVIDEVLLPPKRKSL